MRGSSGGKAKLARIQLVARVRVAYGQAVDAARSRDRAEAAEAEARLRVLNRALAWVALGS